MFLEWSTPFNQPHKVIFKNPDLSKAPKIVRIFLPVQAPPVVYYTKYHDTYTKPISPLHTSIVQSKEIGLKNVYPYNSKPPLVYHAPNKALTSPFDSNHPNSPHSSHGHAGFSLTTKQLNPHYNSNYGGSDHFTSNYPSLKDFSSNLFLQPNYLSLKPNFHSTQTGHHSSQLNHHLIKPSHHSISQGYHHSSQMGHNLLQSGHHFGKDEIASLQSYKQTNFPVTPVTSAYDFHPIPAPKYYHRPKHPTLSPYHLTAAPYHLTSSQHGTSPSSHYLPVQQYLTPAPHYIESPTAAPDVHFYVPQEAEYTGGEEEVFSYEPQLGKDESAEQHITHTAHASISVKSHDHMPSTGPAGVEGHPPQHASKQIAPIEHHDHTDTGRQHSAQAKAFGPLRFPLPLNHFSPLAPNVPPAYAKAPFLFQQNYHVLPLSNTRSQPVLKFRGEHGSTHSENLPTTFLYPLHSSTPFPPGKNSDRSVRPVTEDVDQRRRQHNDKQTNTSKSENNTGGEDNDESDEVDAEKGNIFMTSTMSDLPTVDPMLNGTIGIKEMSYAVAMALKQEKCEEKCVTESKIGDKGEPTCGSDGKIYPSKTQLLCAHKCGRRGM